MIARYIFLAAIFLPPLAFAQRAITQPARTQNFAETAEAKVIFIEPVYEDVVIGNRCQDRNTDGSSAGAVATSIMKCIPVLQRKATAVTYVASYQGHDISGVTYRRLRIGDTVNVNVITSITPNE
jgi:hypothetical protein